MSVDVAESVKIERSPVESSSLASIGYNRQTQVLEIEFHSGDVYRYRGVAPSVFEELQGAKSKGAFFSKRIRGKYEFSRVPAAK